MSKADLRLDWCSHAAAKYAVEHWHYSRSLPTPPLVKVGVWESGSYIGCVLFSRGANKNLGSFADLQNTEVCELTRVALAMHQTAVSRIVALAIKFVKRANPGLRLIVSYADPNHGHVGSIYQAGNWIYCGRTPSSFQYRDRNGRIWHQRQVSKTGIKPQYGELRRVAKIDECERIPEEGKYRYLMPLDAAMRAQIEPLRKPYPKRAGSVDSDAAADQAAEGGATPTPALQSVKLT